jgi:hypothetical protein
MIAKKSSEKMKCVVMWLNMCCFSIERHQIRVWAVKVSFDPSICAHCDLHGYKHILVQITISAFI